MDIIETIILPVILAYMIGSIPTAVWVGKLFYGIDIRTKGSGNAGATNTIRTLGLKAGIPVFILDIFKGWFAVYLCYLFNPDILGDKFAMFQICLAIAAVLGHVFPLWAGFKGGKGVATLFGAGLSLYFFPALVVLGIFILVLVLSRIVSISSIIAVLSFPIIAIFIFQYESIPLIILSIVIALFIPITHYKNIKRLFKGEESRFDFKKKK